MRLNVEPTEDYEIWFDKYSDELIIEAEHDSTVRQYEVNVGTFST